MEQRDVQSVRNSSSSAMSSVSVPIVLQTLDAWRKRQISLWSIEIPMNVSQTNAELGTTLEFRMFDEDSSICGR
jgi:hypothetical protein